MPETPPYMSDDADDEVPPVIVFREIPLLIEIEQWIARERGIMWRPEFEERVDQVSVALFGIKRHPKPQQDKFSNRAEFFGAEHAWGNWQRSIGYPEDLEREFGDYAGAEWLYRLGIQVWDADGKDMRCAEWFVEQAIAAALEFDGAKFTPDGSGSTLPADAEEWGASLERAAREFTRKK
jgi:hypothetical protein